MVRVCHDASSAIVGSEEVENMSDRQLEILYMYEWPKKHHGPDVEGFQGLGGLLYQMKKEMDQLEDAAEQNRQARPEQRQREVEEDRSHPHLVKLDKLADELMELEKQGELEDASFSPDWRTELGAGEEIYVQVCLCDLCGGSFAVSDFRRKHETAPVILLFTCPSTSSVSMPPLPMRAQFRRIFRAHTSHNSP